jgi:hypothetical protein
VAAAGTVSGELPALGLRPAVLFLDDLVVGWVWSSSLVMVAAEALRFLVWGDVVKDVAQYAVVLRVVVLSTRRIVPYQALEF